MEVVKKGEPGYDIEKDRRNSTFKIDEEGVAFMRNRQIARMGRTDLRNPFHSIGNLFFYQAIGGIDGSHCFFMAFWP